MARRTYTDEEIERLVLEAKPLSFNWRKEAQAKVTSVDVTQIVICTGEENHNFQLILRQSKLNSPNFCLTLGFFPEGSNELFRIRRYDGKYHQHSNPIEKDIRFYDFHIHMATEKYQNFGMKEEDKYAITTDRYSDYEGALNCLLSDCNFQIPDDPQLSLLNS